MLRAITRRLPRRDDEGSMFLALMLVIMGLALLLTSAAYVTSEHNKVLAGRDFTSATHAANDGVQRALAAINVHQYPPLPSQSPATGTGADGSSWSYSGTPSGDLQDGNYTWTIKSVGKSGNVTQTEVAVLEAQPGSTGVPWPDGLFANSTVGLQRGKVTSYIAGVGLDAGNALVGTNGSLTLGTGVVIDGYDLWNWQAKPNGGRCVSPAGVCTSANAAVFNQEDNYSDPDNSELVNQYRGQCIGSPTAWTASATPTIPAGVSCYSSMNFNANTTVAGTAANPSIVVVTGTGAITVSPGVSVNGTTAYRDASNFQVFSNTASGFSVTSSTATATNFTGSLSLPKSACTTSATASVINLYGAFACKSWDSAGTFATNVYIDEFGVVSSQSTGQGTFGQVFWDIKSHSLG